MAVNQNLTVRGSDLETRMMTLEDRQLLLLNKTKKTACSKKKLKKKDT